MAIHGLYADEATGKFAPDQHVNIYDAMTHDFYCEARMDALPEEVSDDPESYFLEPTDEEGRPVRLRVALGMEPESGGLAGGAAS